MSDLKAAVLELQPLQVHDGSVPEKADHEAARTFVGRIVAGIQALAPLFPHDASYLDALVVDLQRWQAEGFGIPDFYDALVAFHPEHHRENGLRHLVLFPMYTQNGSADRLVEAVLIEVVWPEFIANLEQTYTNALFVPIRFLDFTHGYDTNSAVLFPETVAMREIPTFTGVRSSPTGRPLVSAASRSARQRSPSSNCLPTPRCCSTDQKLAEETFVMWDLIHDRTHMRGDLPFDPFMIKQRMPFFLYSLEELRCDLTAFRESVRLVRADDTDATTREHAALTQYAILFDRMFRFPLTGDRVRNYDGLGGQLLSPGCTSTRCCTGPTPPSRSTGPTFRMSWCNSPTRSTSCTAQH